MFDRNPSDPNRLDEDSDGVACEALLTGGFGSTGDDGSLPFTGLALWLLLAAGVALTATGLVIRRGLHH